jgi:UDP-N-acetylmuramate--alanine ligase
MEFSVIAAALAEFVGPHRRFELKGQVGDVLFIDDYAHHPSEIQATLAAASLQERRIVAVFQPHRPSRLASLFEDFTHAFAQADCVVVTPVYTAGEPDQLQASSVKLAAALAQVHPQVYYEPTLANLPTALAARLQPADLVLFLGAGDLNQSISATIKAYSHHAALTNQAGVGSNLSAPVMDDAEVLVS